MRALREISLLNLVAEQTVMASETRQIANFCKRGKTGGGMNLRFTGGHESDSFWECCRLPTSMAYRTPI
jgi:hypothetical protein